MSDTNGTGEKVEAVVQDAGKEIGELGRELRQRADDIRKETVKQLNTTAKSIRKEAHDATESAEARKAADQVANGLEKAAHYLNTHSVEEMGVQATRVVRQNSTRIMVVAFIVGVLIGLMMQSNKSRR